MNRNCIGAWYGFEKERCFVQGNQRWNDSHLSILFGSQYCTHFIEWFTHEITSMLMSAQHKCEQLCARSALHSLIGGIVCCRCSFANDLEIAHTIHRNSIYGVCYLFHSHKCVWKKTSVIGHSEGQWILVGRPLAWPSTQHRNVVPKITEIRSIQFFRKWILIVVINFKHTQSQWWYAVKKRYWLFVVNFGQWIKTAFLTAAKSHSTEIHRAVICA